MTLHSITSSRPLSYAYITGYRSGNYNGYIEGPIISGTAKTNFITSYTPSLEVNLYGVRGNYSDSQGSYSVNQYGTVPASFLNVGNATADAMYDSTALRFYDITTNGTCDVLRGILSYTTTDRRVVWMIFSSTGVTEMTFPMIPGNILTEAGVDLQLLRKAGSIAIDDFDTMINYDDYISYLYLSSHPFITSHTNLYTFSKTASPPSTKTNTNQDKMDGHGQISDERINW
jgi:hypothetical protein